MNDGIVDINMADLNNIPFANQAVFKTIPAWQWQYWLAICRYQQFNNADINRGPI